MNPMLPCCLSCCVGQMLGTWRNRKALTPLLRPHRFRCAGGAQGAGCHPQAREEEEGAHGCAQLGMSDLMVTGEQLSSPAWSYQAVHPSPWPLCLLTQPYPHPGFFVLPCRCGRVLRLPGQEPVHPRPGLPGAHRTALRLGGAAAGCMPCSPCRGCFLHASFPSTLLTHCCSCLALPPHLNFSRWWRTASPSTWWR